MRKIDRTGEEKINNFGSLMRIKEYRSNKDIDVYFPEYNWTKTQVQYNTFIKGEVKCPYEKTVYGVGYTGEGKYKVNENGKITKCHSIWRSMLERCYNPNYIQKHPTYEQSEVCEEWYNFQVFAKWYYDNYYQIEGETMNLDKDILCKGNKIYSKETCVFVPQNINKLFTKCNGRRGDSPIGVSYNKSNENYRSLCRINGKTKHLGCYNTPEEAFQAYKNFKEQYIKEVANQYKNVIPQQLYTAMINYQVEIND